MFLTQLHASFAMYRSTVSLPIQRFAVGEVNVVAKIRATNVLEWCEGNGGVICTAKPLWS